jgi:hypothetical protein
MGRSPWPTSGSRIDKASLVMIFIVVASWMYAWKQGWDRPAKAIAGFIGVVAVALSLFIVSRTRCPNAEIVWLHGHSQSTICENDGSRLLPQLRLPLDEEVRARARE